jgi:zeaxanthin glucosyltransferase
MAVIAIPVDTEQGHIFPTFRLAKKLLARGHQIYYIGLAAVEDEIRKQGFEFRRIMEGVTPARLMTRPSTPSKGGQMDRLTQDRYLEAAYLEALVRGEAIDDLMQELKPDVALMSCHQYTESIVIRYRYNVPVVSLTTHLVAEPRTIVFQNVIDHLINVPCMVDLIDLLLSAKVEIKNFADVAALILQMPELVFYPKAFELPGIDHDPLFFHVGHEVDLGRWEEPFDWGQLRADGPLIYCSLGSQLDHKSEISRQFIRTVIAAAAKRSDWQFVVALGAKLNAKEFEPIPQNVVLSHWAPQIQMLSRASVMITHAGLGGVKESILHGVPMLALPLMRDQFDSANRITHHGLGAQGDIERIGPEDLSSMLDRLIADRSIRERVSAMRDEFERAEALNLSVTIIEKVIAGRPLINSI